MEGNHVRLGRGQRLVLTTREMVGNEEMIFVNYKGLAKSMEKGDPILLGDGEIKLEVVKVGKHTVTCGWWLAAFSVRTKVFTFPKAASIFAF